MDIDSLLQSALARKVLTGLPESTNAAELQANGWGDTECPVAEMVTGLLMLEAAGYVEKSDTWWDLTLDGYTLRYDWYSGRLGV